MNKAIILLGSNIGDSHEHLQKGRAAIEEEIGYIQVASSLYVTAPWGNVHQSDFLNQVVVVQTSMGAKPVLDCLLQIEHRTGRVRIEKNAPRTLDLDILFFNDEIIDTPDLQVPHPRLHERNFVLVPLVELTPEYIHPVIQKSIRVLHQNCPDPLAVHKLS